MKRLALTPTPPLSHLSASLTLTLGRYLGMHHSHQYTQDWLEAPLEPNRAKLHQNCTSPPVTHHRTSH